jgi:SAM-dependent MidA family methyltransferase
VILRQIIEKEIRKRGPMPFSRYMELCLYHPELGYYARSAEKFGKAGDFFTSSDVHAVFGRLLARQFEEMWRALDSPETIELVELGPGLGGEEVSGVLPRAALPAGGRLARAASQDRRESGGAHR